MDAAYKSRPCTVARRVYGHFNGLGSTFASDLTAEERRIAQLSGGYHRVPSIQKPQITGEQTNRGPDNGAEF